MTNRAYRILVTLSDGTKPRWVTMIAPGLDKEKALRSAKGRFGVDRVLKIESLAA